MRKLLLIPFIVSFNCQNLSFESQALAYAETTYAEGANLLTCEPKPRAEKHKYPYALNVVRTIKAEYFVQFLVWNPGVSGHLEPLHEIQIKEKSLYITPEVFILTDDRTKGNYVHLYHSNIDKNDRGLVDVALGGSVQTKFNTKGPVTNPDLSCSRNGGQ